MASSATHAAFRLSRTTSRTRTARTPLQLGAVQTGSSHPFDELYAGPVNPAAHPPASPYGQTWPPWAPFEGVALQIHARSATPGQDGVRQGRPAPMIYVLVDLGADLEIARIELHGNHTLPPMDDRGRPMFNFGLPRSIAVGVAEDPLLFTDLHGRRAMETWFGPGGDGWKTVLRRRNLRATWTWTPLHFPPAYGRYLLLVLADLPMLPPAGDDDPVRGVDIQRLVVFPCLESTDHRSSIEYTPISSRQSAYTQPSAYWTGVGLNPDPDDHQSLAKAGDGVIFPPSNLVPVLPETEPTNEFAPYASDIVRLDSEDRVRLTIQATTDEIPLVSGVMLKTPRPDALAKYWWLDFTAAANTEYLVSVDVTSDPEAAWSPVAAHPAWRRMVTDRPAGLSQLRIRTIMFPQVEHARYVRITARLATRGGARPGSGIAHGHFILLGLTLLRPRDFVLRPQDSEDYSVDAVAMRIRGPDLASDYAFLDGASGMRVVLEMRSGDGAHDTWREMHTLLGLIEDGQARLIGNLRTRHTPVQRFRETVDAVSHGEQSSTARSDTDTTAGPIPGTRSLSVTRSGTLTEHVDNAAAALRDMGAAVHANFPDVDSIGVITTRDYLVSGDLPTGDVELGSSFGERVNMVIETVSQAVAFGYPASFGLGANANVDVSPLGIGGGVGGSVSASISAGGGTTHSYVTGSQSATTVQHSETLHQESHQRTASDTTATSTRDGTSHDERDIERTDLSEERRRAEVNVQFGGEPQDLILVTLPIRKTLRGALRGAFDQVDRRGADELRVRIEHVPRSVSIDVEFKGMVIPRAEDD